MKLSAASFDAQGKFLPGPITEWMEHCYTNLRNAFACDAFSHWGIGLSCAAVWRETAAKTNYGSDPVPFDDMWMMAVDRHDIRQCATAVPHLNRCQKNQWMLRYGVLRQRRKPGFAATVPKA
ncbi:MAG TPA: hypothetical protein PLO69_11350 [Gammaproteobacteria bacterium]|nr:hypothetical protein [Gammaproteobacteria bacterium]